MRCSSGIWLDSDDHQPQEERRKRHEAEGVKLLSPEERRERAKATFEAWLKRKEEQSPATVSSVSGESNRVRRNPSTVLRQLQTQRRVLQKTKGATEEEKKVASPKKTSAEDSEAAFEAWLERKKKQRQREKRCVASFMTM